MTKATKLSEYKKGYDLITDDEFNGLFVAHIMDLKNYILKEQKAGGIYYQVRSVDLKDKKIKLYQDTFTIEYTDNNVASQDKLAAMADDFACQFYQDHPTRTIVMIVYCYTAQFIHDNQQVPGLLVSAQTADGRCCMAWYKMIAKEDIIVGFEAIEEHIPKKHTNDEEYIWEGSTIFFERVAKLNK